MYLIHSRPRSPMLRAYAEPAGRIAAVARSPAAARPESRHDRFHGFLDDSFIERYAEKCADDGTIIMAYMENGVVRGAAELHPPEQSPDSLPEIAFSVEASVRRRGVGSILFRRLITEARWKGYRSLRVTTGAQNEAMRALASKFGAQLVFRHGESTGTIDLTQQHQAELASTWADAVQCGARGRELQSRLWRMLFRMYGWAAPPERRVKSAQFARIDKRIAQNFRARF